MMFYSITLTKKENPRVVGKADFPGVLRAKERKPCLAEN